MRAIFRLLKEAVGASVRFVRAYPGMCAIAVVVYAASAALSIEFLSPLVSYGNTGSQVLSWVGELPQTILLAPVWTALLRFVILRDNGRRYLAWDRRVRRVLLVTVILSAILTAGGLPFALASDLLRRFPIRLLIARAVLIVTLIGKLASVWLIMRLAIAPALAAAGTRRYALDTALSFTRRWFGTIFMVKFFIYAPLFALVGGLMYFAGFRPDLQSTLFAQPISMVAVTLTTAIAELIDGAAMALVAVRIVRARKRKDEPDDDGMS